MTDETNRIERFSSLSVVLPCFEEAQNIPEIYLRITKTLEVIPQEYEVILVDDGSLDNSWDVIEQLCETDSHFRGLSLSRNFGQQQALLAGLSASRGELIVTLDADLQDPPELIPEMINCCEQGSYIVHAVRTKREHDSFFKKIFALLFYATIRRATGLDIPSNTGEFRLVRRRVAQAVLSMNEARPFLRGMFAWVGFKRGYVHYERPNRFAGKAKFTFTKSFALATDAFVSFSHLKQKLQALMSICALFLCICTIAFFSFESLTGVYLLLCILIILQCMQVAISAFLDLDGRANVRRVNYIIQQEIGRGLELSIEDSPSCSTATSKNRGS